MKLDPADRLNPLLPRLIAGWKDELAALRAQNDHPLTPEETQTLRGRIAQLKAHIALGDEPPLILD